MKFGEGRWRSFLPPLEARRVEAVRPSVEISFRACTARLSAPHTLAPQAAFARAGVVGFNMDGKTGPTVDSHRLIWWGKTFGKQDAIVEELFKAYFMCGGAITIARPCARIHHPPFALARLLLPADPPRSGVTSRALSLTPPPSRTSPLAFPSRLSSATAKRSVTSMSLPPLRKGRAC